MKSKTSTSLKLSAVAFATALLFGCGGGNGIDSAGTAGASAVQVSETANALRVSVASDDSSSAGSTVLAQAQYTFSATVSAGPDAGQTISGTLMLKTEQGDDGTEVEGLLVPTTAAATTTTSTATDAQVAALREQLKTKLADLRSAYRADVQVLLDTLRAAMKAGAPTDGSHKLSAAQKEALAAFKTAFAERTTRYETDVATVTQDIRSQLQALGVTLSDKGSRGGDDDERSGMKGYPVKGRIAADGTITLSIRYGRRTVVTATGTASATDGSLSGTFEVPSTGDKGTWSATTAARADRASKAPKEARRVRCGRCGRCIRASP